MRLYIIREVKGLYVGTTSDLERRMKEHKNTREQVELLFDCEIPEDNELVKQAENSAMEMLGEVGNCLNKYKSAGMMGGYKLSAQAKSNQAKGKNKAVEQVNFETGEVIKEFESVKQASKELGVPETTIKARTRENNKVEKVIKGTNYTFRFKEVK